MSKGTLRVCCEGWVAGSRKCVYNTLDAFEIFDSKMIAVPNGNNYKLYWVGRNGSVTLLENEAISYPRDTPLINGPTFVAVTPCGAFLSDGTSTVMLSVQIESQ